MDKLEQIKSKAERLYEVRKAIETIEEEVKNKIESLKTERDVTQLELIILMKEVDLSSIKISSGDSYSKAVRHGLAITSELKAMSWAKENHAIKIDLEEVKKKLKDSEKLPEGFTPTTVEYISVRKAKEAK